MPVVANGTLFTAGWPVVLTAPEVVADLEELDDEKARKAVAQRACRGAREKLPAELKPPRDAKAAVAEEAKDGRRGWLHAMVRWKWQGTGCS